MANRLDISWPRILAEGTAIVVSILLAFWIQAWWEERQSSDEESTVIQALLEDLRQKQMRLDADRRLSEAIIDSSTRLLNAPSAQAETLDGHTIDTLIGDLTWYGTETSWESAPMNSLMMGGNISVLSNQALVQKLASLQVRMNRRIMLIRQESRFHWEAFIPFLRQNANLVQIMQTQTRSPSGLEGDVSIPDVVIMKRRDHSELLSRDDFRGLVASKMGHHLNARAYGYPQLDDELNEILDLLEKELAN